MIPVNESSFGRAGGRFRRVSRRNRERQHLGYCPRVNPKLPRRFRRAQTRDLNRVTNPPIKLHTPSSPRPRTVKPKATCCRSFTRGANRKLTGRFSEGIFDPALTTRSASRNINRVMSGASGICAASLPIVIGLVATLPLDGGPLYPSISGAHLTSDSASEASSARRFIIRFAPSKGILCRRLIRFRNGFRFISSGFLSSASVLRWP